MAAPAVFGVPTTALQPPFAYPPFGPTGPLWFTVLLSQLPDATTTAKPTTNPQIVLLPYPAPPYPAPPYPAPAYPGPPYYPVAPTAPGLCNVNCPAVWQPLCTINGAGLMYNFANLCALQAQNCVSGSDFRYVYSGICRLKR